MLVIGTCARVITVTQKKSIIWTYLLILLKFKRKTGVKQILHLQIIKNGLRHINEFVPNTPFLYPSKTSENRKVFWFFQGVEKECIGNKWVKYTSLLLHTLYLTHFMPLVSFYSPWKRQKTSSFLIFLGGIERDQWHEMVWAGDLSHLFYLSK